MVLVQMHCEIEPYKHLLLCFNNYLCVWISLPSLTDGFIFHTLAKDFIWRYSYPHWIPTKEHLIHCILGYGQTNTLHFVSVITFAFEFHCLHLTDAFALDSLGHLAPRSASLDGVLLKIVSYPCQVAVTDERISCQMSVWRERDGKKMKCKQSDRTRGTIWG